MVNWSLLKEVSDLYNAVKIIDKDIKKIKTCSRFMPLGCMGENIIDLKQSLINITTAYQIHDQEVKERISDRRNPKEYTHSLADLENMIVQLAKDKCSDVMTEEQQKKETLGIEEATSIISQYTDECINQVYRGTF